MMFKSKPNKFEEVSGKSANIISRMLGSKPVQTAAAKPPFKEIAGKTGMSAVWYGVQGLSKAAVENLPEYQENNITQSEFGARMVRGGAQYLLEGGAKAFSAYSLQEVIKQVAKRYGKRIFKFSRSYTMTLIAFSAVEQGIDTWRYSKGKISKTEFKVVSTENAGGAGGAIAGAGIGAMLGSSVPIIGTGVGAFFGAFFGSIAGEKGGRVVGEMVFKEEEEGTKA